MPGGAGPDATEHGLAYLAGCRWFRPHSESLPVIAASLWVSLRQLHTGPTAILALMSAGG